MLREELTARLSDFESKQRVQTWTWNGWRAWPALRNHLALSLHQRAAIPVETDWKARVRGILLRRRQSFARWLADFLENGPRPDDPTDVVFLTSTDRGQALGGRLYNTVVDPWVEEVLRTGYRACVWDVGNPRRGADRTHIGVQHAIDEYRRRNRSERPHAPEWLPELTAFCHDELDADLGWDEVFRELDAIDQHAELFEEWLGYAQPRIVFLDCWYTRERMGAALAAHRLGIPTIDLQHGIQGHAHPAYAGWSAPPDGPYELMPDSFWVWGSWDAESLLRSNAALTEDRVRVVGHRWLHSWTEGDGQAQRAAIREARRLAAHSPTVCVTLQKGVPYREMLAPLVKAAPAHWLWLVRLHRGMHDDPEALQSELRAEIGPNLEVVQASRLPLHALLRVSRWHVTGFSTCALEALPFGVPTLLTHESGEHAFAEFIDEGVMHALRSPEDAVALLAQTSAELADACRESGARVFAAPGFGGPWCTPS